MSIENYVAIDREELARLRADSAELARVRESVDMVEFEEFDWPDYHHQAMGCGLEDRNITDRYEAMQYGWDEAIERCCYAFENYKSAVKRAIAQAGQIPEGFALVPVEPTIEMIAAIGFEGDVELAIGHGAIFNGLRDDYKRMLAAAPKGDSHE